jgi:hypothetical protein
MQFIQANASWIFFGLALVFMLWMHGGGHRHGMGGGSGMGHEHGGAHQHDGPPAEGEAEKLGSGQTNPAASATHEVGQGGRSAGCH